MPNRSEDLRREAARCLDAARKTNDLGVRDELVRLAEKLLAVADSARADFDDVSKGIKRYDEEPKRKHQEAVKCDQEKAE
jgi:hypothetical protein